MSPENIELIRGYAAFFFTMFLALVFIGYIIHLYTSVKKGGKDYEQYGNLALDDEPTSHPVDPIDRNETLDRTTQKD
jgi:cytochrome c oxidase cbb3-type subunit 4